MATKSVEPSGYAKYYLDAIGAGYGDSVAHTLANAQTGGSGLDVGAAKKMTVDPNKIGTNAETGFAASMYDDPGRVVSPFAGTLMGRDPKPEAQKKTDLSYDAPEYMSDEEARRRAEAQLKPKFDAARNTTIRSFADQRELLPQLLNARGQLFGGLRAGGESKITQKQAEAMEKMNLEYQSALSQMALAIQEEDYARASQLAQMLYKKQVDQAALDNQAWNNNMTQWNSDQNRAMNALQWALGDLRTQEAAELAQSNWQKNFDQTAENYAYNREQDAKDYAFDERKFMIDTFGIDPVTGQKSWARQQAELANSQRGSGGGSGGGGGGGTKATQPNYGQLVQGVNSLVNSLKQPYSVNLAPSSNVSKMLPGFFPAVSGTANRTNQQVYDAALGQVLGQAGNAGLSSTELNGLIGLTSKLSGVQPWFDQKKTTDW